MDKIEDGVLRLAQNPYSCPKVKVKPHNENIENLLLIIILFYTILMKNIRKQ